jgi:hypothetical protein
MKPETCKSLWTPWESAIKRNTVEEHIKAAVKCFGRDVVEFAFPDECAQYLGEVKVVSSARVVTPAKPAPAKPAPVEDVLDIGTDMPEPLVEEAPKPAPKPTAKTASKGGGVTEDLEAEYEKLLGGDDTPPF